LPPLIFFYRSMRFHHAFRSRTRSVERRMAECRFYFSFCFDFLCAVQSMASKFSCYFLDCVSVRGLSPLPFLVHSLSLTFWLILGEFNDIVRFLFSDSFANVQLLFALLENFISWAKTFNIREIQIGTSTGYKQGKFDILMKRFGFTQFEAGYSLKG